MIWEDECYLLSKRKFRENANIINIFTQKKESSMALFMEEPQGRLEIICRYLINYLFLILQKAKIELDISKLNWLNPSHSIF